MKYEDFEIRISSAGAGRLEIRVEGEAGEGSHLTDPGMDPLEARRMLGEFRALALNRPAPGPVTQGHGPAKARGATRDLAELGRTLFSLVLPRKLRTLWDRSLVVAARRGIGLRLRLHLDQTRRELAWFGALPWELLYDDDSGGFLVLDGRTPVVRYLDVSQERRPFPRARPWRILVVMPHPDGATPLDLESERQDLVETWDGGREVELVFPDRATFDGVRAALRRGPIHGIHYMGHAGFDERTGKGGLVLEAEEGGPSILWASEVSDLIKGAEPPALVVLNSCQTARSGGDSVSEPFGGVAAALVKAGVPAVVAQQVQVRNADATRFSKVLYQTLQDGYPIDWAVSEARLSLTKTVTDRPVWAIPSLFMRVADGRLFDETEAQLEPAETGVPVEVNANADDQKDESFTVTGAEVAPGDRLEGISRVIVNAQARRSERSPIIVTGLRRK